jgi:hypothetical protein
MFSLLILRRISLKRPMDAALLEGGGIILARLLCIFPVFSESHCWETGSTCRVIAREEWIVRLDIVKDFPRRISEDGGVVQDI